MNIVRRMFIFLHLDLARDAVRLIQKLLRRSRIRDGVERVVLHRYVSGRSGIRIDHDKRDGEQWKTVRTLPGFRRGFLGGCHHTSSELRSLVEGGITVKPQKGRAKRMQANGSKAICRVRNVLRSPSPDPLNVRHKK